MRGLVLVLALASSSVFAGITVTNLQCGYWPGPLGVDDASPRLSWQLLANSPGQRGQLQTACRILVASSTNILANNQGDLWDSGQTNVTSPGILYGGIPLVSEQQVFWEVEVWDQNNQPSGWSSPATWSMGLLNPTNWLGSWISTTNNSALPVFQRQFVVQPGLGRALIYICGLGQYQLSANGMKVGSALLAPGWSMYPKTCLYDTLDITSYLTSGTNALGVMLGNGMYDVPVSSRYAKFTGSFGPPEVIAQIHLFYTNGTSQVIVSDTNWLTTSGPITFSSVYGGENYDARLLPSGWNQAGFNASAWSVPVVTNGPGGILRGQSHAAPPIEAVQTIQPVRTNTLSSSVIVYDLGQNAAIMPALTAHGQSGAVIQITPAETTNSDGSVNRTSVGGGAAYWQYTLAGTGSQTWSSLFFYHGCRYLEVQLTAASGSSQLPVMDNLQGVVIQSAVPPVGSFSCSIPLFDQTETLIRWAQRNNLISILTDCPHRERLGWLEEAHLNGPSLRYEFDMDKFSCCSLDAMADSQLGSGLVPDIAPEFTVFSGGFRDSPEWGSSVILVPWQQYQFTGDDTLLRRYYGAMTNYLAYLQTQASGYILSYGLGDWYDIGPAAEGYEQLTPLGVTATAYFYQDAQTLARIATEIGRLGDAANFSLLATNIAAAFNNDFYSAASGYYATGSQTAQAMPLELGMVNPTNQSSVLATLVANVKSQGSTTGEVGHRYLLRALTDAGRADIVYNIDNVTNYSPNAGGYGYMLSQGATSATEGWNADPSDSLDHFMWGQIIEWFYHDLAGIQSDPSAPGFRNVIIKPAFVGNVTWVDASYDSVAGLITSYWTLTNSQATVNVIIPPGATGKIYLPTLGTATNNLVIQESGVTIMQNGAVAGSATSVNFDDLEGAATQTYAVWAVGSGSYQFSYAVYPAPSGLSAVAGNAQVALSWNAAPNATGYNVKRATVSGGPYAVVGGGVIGTNFTDVVVTNGTKYYYVVSALRSNGESYNSAEISVTPTLPSSVPNYGFETPNIGTYQYDPSGGSWTFTAQSGANGSGIAANNSAFTSANSNAPQGFQVAFLQGAATVSQTLNGFLSGQNYAVTFAAAQRNYQQNGGQTWNVTINGTVVGSFAPPRAATSYTNYTASFTASAASQALAFVSTDIPGGDNTVFIDNVQISPLPPSPPAGLAATADNGFVVLAWNPVAGAASYNVKRSNAVGGAYASLFNTTLTNYTDIALANRVTYYYEVSALNSIGEGSNSAPAAATPGSQLLTGTIIGTPGSWDNLGNTISNVFDGNLNTFFDGPDATGDWAGLDFGGGVSNVITEILYCPRSGFASRMTNGVFQAANAADFGGASNLFTISAVSAQGVLTPQVITITNAFRYVRYIGPANGNCDVAEVQFYGWNPAVLPTSTAPPVLTWQNGGGQLQFTWPADHIGWVLQSQANPPGVGLTTNWVPVISSALTNQVSVPLNPTNGTVFFRLVYP
jgi:hypothetical protein